jgi:hypothetical protein
MRAKNRRTIGIIFLLIWFLPLVDSVSACTIFTVTDGQSIFFCGNEDNSEAFQWRIWFDPATKTRYGRAFLGFRIGNNLDVPMAGINDQGLAIDLSAVAFAPINISPERETVKGAIYVKWLSDCATVKDVIEQMSRYNVIDLETNPNQIHVADKTGDAIVIGVDPEGELNTTNISGSYLVSTNFNMNDKTKLEYELHHKGRYNTTATGLETLLHNSDLSVEGCRDILMEVALNPDLGYGYVVDLRQGHIFLYSHDDFERTAVLDINEELAKGPHSYALETLVTQQTGVIGPYIRNSILFSSLIIIIVFGLSCGLYFITLRPIFRSEPNEIEKYAGLTSFITSRLGITNPGARLLVFCTFYAILLIFLKMFVKIGPVYINYDWTSMIYLYFTIFPALIIATNFRPSIAFILSSVGVIINELTFCLLNGYGGELWIQLILRISSFVGTTVIISLLWKKNKVIAFFLGTFWYFIGFYIPAYYYYCVVFYFDSMGLFIYSIAHVLIYIGLIPLVFLFNKVFQTLLHKQDLETLLLIK